MVDIIGNDIKENKNFSLSNKKRKSKWGWLLVPFALIGIGNHFDKSKISTNTSIPISQSKVESEKVNPLISYFQKKMDESGPNSGDQSIYLYASNELKKDLKNFENIALGDNKVDIATINYFNKKFEEHISKIKQKLQERVTEGNQPYVIANQKLLNAVEGQFKFLMDKLMKRLNSK